MTLSRLKPLLRSLFSVLVLINSVGLSAPPDETTSDKTEVATPVDKVNNKDIDWDSLGFFGGPRLTGDNAIKVRRGDVRQTVQLLKRLEDDDAFEAAHVLLTSLWRVPERKKNSFSHPLSDGFFVCHNGLFVWIRWEFVDGEEKKVIDIPDVPCQRKRIREFWSARFREHPEEFSPDTKVE